MKRVGLMYFLLAFLVFTTFVFANETLSTNSSGSGTVLTTTETSSVNLTKIEKGFQCLESVVKEDCSGATNVQDIALTILSSPKSSIANSCSERLNLYQRNSVCFGTNSCNVKETALAVLALNHLGKDTKIYQSWLLNQTKVSTDIVWYMQQDSLSSTNCKVTYDSQDFSFNVNENKKISTNAGSCLSLARSNYWYQISPNCFDKDFSLVCDQQFVANLLYKQPNSDLIYVLSNTKSASANGVINLKVKSKCFGESTCDYEGSAWATLALDKTGNNVDEFVPYLISAEDLNKRFLPAAFLHLIVDYSEYGTKLIQQQSLNSWEAENTAYNKFYDTGLALLSLGSSSSEQVSKGRDWLLNLAQEADGCWNNKDIKTTAMALWGIEKRASQYVPPATQITQCTASSFFCIAQARCPTADLLPNYYCSGLGTTCCKTENLQTCSQLYGQACTGGKVCDGLTERSSDVTSCCLGTCVDPEPELNACEASNGFCRTSCSANQKEVSLSCDGTDLVCCQVDNAPQESSSLWWLWILLIILLILIVLAIIFRDNVKVWIYKKQSKFKKEEGNSSSGNYPPRGPPPTSPQFRQGMPPQRPMSFPNQGMPPQNRGFPPQRR